MVLDQQFSAYRHVVEDGSPDLHLVASIDANIVRIVNPSNSSRVKTDVINNKNIEY